jgi:hypothetical protein
MVNPYTYKINNQYSYNLDQYIDLDSLQALYDDIALAVIESRKHYDYLIPPQKLLLEENKSIDTVKKALKDNNLNLDKKDILDYVSYRYNLKPMPMKLLLKIAETSENRMTDKNAIYFEPYNRFKKLVEWLENSNIFETVGTIVIYVNPAGAETSVHRDFTPDVDFQKSQGIWINPYNKKKFFVLDENYHKQYFSGDVNIFELHSWHGSEPSDTNTFTIRVDGYFSKDFLNKCNLEDYYNE